MERGGLRRVFGKVAAVIAVAATLAFYGLGFNIGHAYYEQWQANKAETVATWVQPAQKHTENLPWAAAGTAAALAYGAGFAGIALGAKKRSYGGYYGSSYSSSSSNDGFWLGYVLGGNGSGGRSSGGGSSNDKGGAALALVVIGGVALAAGASVVSYKAVKGNFFTGEESLWSQWKSAREAEKSLKASQEEASWRTLPQEPEKPTVTVEIGEEAAPPPPAAPEPYKTTEIPTVDPNLVKRWKKLSV